MKKINRIKANKDFALAIKKGKTFKNNSYIIHISDNELKTIRIGISVSKKLGIAVTRNKIKRQVRAMCQDIDFDSSSKDIVIIVRNDFLDKTYQENKELLCKTLSEANIGVKK